MNFPDEEEVLVETIDNVSEETKSVNPDDTTDVLTNVVDEEDVDMSNAEDEDIDTNSVENN